MAHAMKAIDYIKEFHSELYASIDEFNKERMHNDETITISCQYVNRRKYVDKIKSLFCNATNMAELLNIDYPTFQSRSIEGAYDAYKVTGIRGIRVGSAKSKWWYHMHLVDILNTMPLS